MYEDSFHGAHVRLATSALWEEGMLVLPFKNSGLPETDLSRARRGSL